jgi:hypothetical protein
MVAPAAAQQGITPKHRITGSYYWQQTPPPPPETKPAPKPEAKTDAKPATAATLAGRWDVYVQASSGSLQSSLDIKADPKDAKKITGIVASQVGEAPFEGEVVDGKMSLWFKMNANGTEISVSFAGSLQKDGSLAGTLTYGQGEIPWTATREKK